MRNIEHSVGLEEVLKTIIDENGNELVEIFEINEFFEQVWSNEEKIKEIQDTAQKQELEFKTYGTTTEEVRNNLGPPFNLVLEVIEVNDDPEIPTSFGVGMIFKITPSGYPDSPRFCADGSTIFGRKCAGSQNKVDLFFNENDNRISRIHFTIISKQQGYFLVDKGSKNCTVIQVT